MRPDAPKPQSRATPRLLNVDDVADQADLSSKTIRRMIARGELRVHRIGRSLRISETDLQTFLVARRR